MSSSWVYWIDGAYRAVAEPTCTTRAKFVGAGGALIETGETWPGHPWAITDPTLPTYQDCARCGLRRFRVPPALFAAIAGRPGHDRRAAIAGVERLRPP